MADYLEDIEKCQKSPIQLHEDLSITTNLPPIVFKNYDKKLDYTIKNTGHTTHINSAVRNKCLLPSISGSGLSEEYLFDNLHFHWTSDHTLNGNRFQMEAHLVHYASKYGNIANAKKYKNGIAVLATLYTFSENGSKVFDGIAKTVKQIAHNVNKPVNLPEAISLRDFLPKDCQSYFRYEGSLLDSEEVALWTVFIPTLTISRRQLKFLQNIYNEKDAPLEINCRPLQELNGRKVYLNIPKCIIKKC